MKKVAIYPGSFDPMTNGHVDIVHRALAMFDTVVVAIANNVRKAPLFTIEERKAQILDAVGSSHGRVEVDAFEGLLVDYVRRRNANIVVRGLRALADFEYEFQLAHMNRRLGVNIDTVFLMTSEKDFYVSSSLVKEVAGFGGDITGLVPKIVQEALEKRFPPKQRKNDPHLRTSSSHPTLVDAGGERQGAETARTGRRRDRIRRR